MEEYPANSRQAPSKSAPDAASRRGTIEPVVTGAVQIRKKPLGKKFAEAFTGESSKSVLEHVVWDVLVPAAKDMIADAGREAIDRRLYGESRGPRRSSVGGTALSSVTSRFNYGAISSRPGFMQDPRAAAAAPDPRERTKTTQGRIDYRDILLATRVEADEVISRMYTLLEQYGQVSVADLFDLLNVTGEYTDEKFGWTNLNGSRAERARSGGYTLALPRLEQLD